MSQFAIAEAGAPGADGAPQGSAFTEKGFYLEEFYGKSLLFALVPPAGERVRELDSLVRTLRELRRNQTRCILIVSPLSLPRVLRRLGRLAPQGPIPIFDPAQGQRSRPYPPDSAVAQIWERLRAGKIVIASTNDDDREDLIVFAQELASRLRVFKLIFVDRDGGLFDSHGRLAFAEVKRTRRLLRPIRGRVRRAEVRAAERALRDGVNSVNLVAPRDVYEELFSFVGAGTLFTELQYGFVRQISIDDFEEVEALILRAQAEGFLLPRTGEQIAALLPTTFGYRVGDEHLAGICSLLTEPYRREHCGELTALYTLTRFHGEGVAMELAKEIIREAQARMLRYVFACTAEERAARFFRRIGFREVKAAEVPAAKWRGYDAGRIARLWIFRYALE
ncbi:MAG TPA: GNAT family N-acetyltransferase [Candidatus Binataceae bacterium]|nr:GNAT family N-acetyltransferase [Candidatus Binataceae bacterium]